VKHLGCDDYRLPAKNAPVNEHLLYSGEYDPEVVERAVILLEEDGTDSILAFVQKHDDTLYRTSPFSEEALSAARNNVLELLEVASASQPPRNRESRSLPMRKNATQDQ
jgi:hypothetical protein